MEQVTDYLLDRYGGITGDICLVTPNRRAGLFLRQHLARKVRQPIWAPEVMRIEDLINRISGLEVMDSISLLFRFYEVYTRMEGDQARPVDDFMRWAPVLLRDMDEVEARAEDPEALYDFLRDAKRIETWNPDGSPPTPFQESYLAFFGRLKTYHKELNDSLIQEGSAYQGLSSRQAALRMKEETFHLPWKKIIFTGFNALNRAEEAIIGTLLRQGLADFLPDNDPYYTENPGHEAGHHIRKTIDRFGSPLSRENSPLAEGPKDIHILGIARNVNQARLAGNLLDQFPEAALNEETAVVLADEDLLVPVLNALPERTGTINVTMGYPLHKTNMYGFFDALFQMYLNARRLGQDGGAEGPSFYHKDLCRFLGHSATRLLWEGDRDGEGTDALVARIALSNRVFIRASELEAIAEQAGGFPERFRFLSSDWTREPLRAFPVMLQLIGRLDELFRARAGSSGKDIINSPFFLDFESLYYFATLFRRLQAFAEKHPYLQSPDTLYTLFRQIAAETRLSFSGEPLQGLQVMGVLETRSLDFKNLVMLSVNEGVIPRGKTGNSFIPYDVKKKFGLQVDTDKDATFAYHFYRLLQRAENVFLIYNTQTQDLGSSEKSRFITQVQHELPRYNPEIRIHEQIVTLPAPPAAMGKALSVEKTPEIMERLREMGERGFSPSALAQFVGCPLQFYLSRVARLEESDQVEETIDASTMGTVVHGVLEKMYRPHIGKVLQAAHIDGMLKEADRLTRLQFEEDYPEGDIRSGKNLLLFYLARQYVVNFLEAEKSQLAGKGQGDRDPLTVLSLEQWLEATLEVQAGGQVRKVKIRGKADRIDRSGGITRVVDYKTGKVDEARLKFKEWELVTSDSRYAMPLQLLTYAWLLLQELPDTARIEPGIASLREVNKGLQTLRYPEGEGPLEAGLVNGFGRHLKSLLSEILDPGKAFVQTEDETQCTYCPYRVLCRRF